jgi:spermidine/putrescine transport system substrate-binding protein
MKPKLTLFNRIVMLVGLSCSALSVAAQTPSEEIVWTCPPEFAGQSLAVYNWAEYIGETTISDFEQLCDVTVTQDFYDTNESLLTRLRQGNPGFDVAFPNDYMVQVLQKENLLQPINLDNIPNIANVDKAWLGMYYDPENAYSVPYLWSSFGVGYRTEAFPDGITSWEDVFTHDGAVTWIADQRAMFPIALTLLGYDPNTLDETQIQEAKLFLLDNAANVVALNEGYRDPLVTGEADALLTYNAEMYALITECECEDYGYAVPQEGSIVDVTAAVVLEGANNPRLAEAFIDYLNDPYVAAQITNSIAYPTTNRAAIESGFVDETLLANPAVFMTEEAMQTVFFLQPVTEAEQAYNDAWDELRIELGQ